MIIAERTTQIVSIVGNIGDAVTGQVVIRVGRLRMTGGIENGLLVIADTIRAVKRGLLVAAGSGDHRARYSRAAR